MKAIALLAPVLIAAPVLFAAPDAVARPADTPAASQDSDPADLPDLSGTWAQKVVTSAVSKVSMLGDVVSQTVALNQVQIKQDGRNLTIISQPCDINLKSDQKMIKTQIPRAYIDAMESKTRKATLSGDPGQYYLDIPGKTTVLGANLEALGDELPTEASDARVLDPDNDGHPGMTMRISGFIDSDLYMVQKSWDQMKGKILPGDKIAGEVTWKTDQVILDATSKMVGDSPKSAQHSDPKQSYFRMTRVDAGSKCGTIIKNKDSLF